MTYNYLECKILQYPHISLRILCRFEEDGVERSFSVIARVHRKAKFGNELRDFRRVERNEDSY